MDFFNELWNMAIKGGPFANAMLLLVLYFVNEERKEVIKENRAREAKNEAMIERLFTALNSVNSAMKELHDTLGGAGEKK